ncbi:MAG: sigma-70 family RNA polymerase sigma factor [Endomicrobia bacterium]|nr:sigma-70 family RNA polymerase sigma factor [Endomicrobiia bacterium]
MRKTPEKNKQVAVGSAAPSAQDVEKYFPLALAVARRYSVFFPFMEIEELAAEGELGLLEAFSRYKKDKKAVFSTYAWFWVLKRIHDYVNKNIGIVEVPKNVRKNFIAVKKLIDSGTKAGREISDGEIASALGLKQDEVSDLLALAGNASSPLSLDAEIDSGDQKKNYYDSIEDKSRPGVFEEISQRHDSMLLEDMLSGLSQKERDVLSFRFALGGRADKKMSIKEIAHRLNMTPAKVKDCENSALVKLRGMMKNADEQK